MHRPPHRRTQRAVPHRPLKRTRIDVATQGRLTLLYLEELAASATTRPQAARAVSRILQAQRHFQALHRRGVSLAPDCSLRCDALVLQLLGRVLLAPASPAKPATPEDEASSPPCPCLLG